MLEVREESEGFIRRNLETGVASQDCLIYVPHLGTNTLTVFDVKEKKKMQIALDFKLPQYWVGYVHARDSLFIG